MFHADSEVFEWFTCYNLYLKRPETPALLLRGSLQYRSKFFCVLVPLEELKVLNLRLKCGAEGIAR